jgi:hypothetical protein
MLLWFKASVAVVINCYSLLISRSTGPEFAWKDMPAGTTFCDIGGGIGSVSMALAKAHPHLKVTLQDLPSVIEQAFCVSMVHRTSQQPSWFINSYSFGPKNVRRPSKTSALISSPSISWRTVPPKTRTFTTYAFTSEDFRRFNARNPGQACGS